MKTLSSLLNKFAVTNPEGQDLIPEGGVGNGTQADRERWWTPCG
jgi:hypothetical protein